MSDIYTLDDLDGAVNALLDGKVIDWQPGDGTRYECLRFTASGDTFFAVLNLGGWTAKVNSDWPRSVDQWISVGLPRGCWRGLRPLLHAMGWARGSAIMEQRDIAAEFEARSEALVRGDRPEQVLQRRHDERIGRMVRNLLEAEGLVLQEKPFRLQRDVRTFYCGSHGVELPVEKYEEHCNEMHDGNLIGVAFA